MPNFFETITFICGVILCIIGVSTFVSGLITRAKKDGQLEYKVDSVLKSIDEIKITLSRTSSWQEAMSKTVEGHEQRIITLFNQVESLEKRINILEEMRLYNEK